MARLKEHFINSFVKEIGQINGTDFEYLCRTILALILKEDIQHKGHNLYCKPVGYTADFFADDYEIIGQCGTELNYFDDFNKPLKDIEGCLKNHNNCKSVYLFANQRAPGGKLTDLDAVISMKWMKTPKVMVIDAEKIANIILLNISNTVKIEEVLSYLPKTYEYYRILPQTNKLPSFKTKYFERKEESEIIEKLKVLNHLQIFGISGIGKTEISISIAHSIQDQFESVIWLDGDSLSEVYSLSSVHISKFNNTLNLDYFLQEFKILLIVDNLNINVQEFLSLFTNSNKHNSKCIITSLQRNIEATNSYNLLFVDPDIAKKILLSSKTQPSNTQLISIIDEVSGYPLVLNLIVSSIEVDDFSWDDIITELANLKDFPDSKNIKLSERIIGKFKCVLNTELQWLKQINNRKISRNFLDFTIGKKRIAELEKRSLIRIEDSFFFDTHQLILDSIKSEIVINDNQFILDGLEKYLFKYNEIKNIDYFHFLLNHNGFIRGLYNTISFTQNLKKVILYSLIQATDSFNFSNWFLTELDQIEYKPKKNYYDLLLLIEKSEIELYQIDRTTEDYELKCKEIIDKLIYVLNSVTESNFKIVLNHHIGKFYSRLKDHKNAIAYFNKVISDDVTADYSRLQLARIYISDKEFDKAKIEIEKMLSKEVDFKTQSLSILLSFYDLLFRNELRDERTKFIDERIESFIKVILSSIDSNFEQPYLVLEKLSSHLGYLQKESFNEICEALPFPSNIDNNRKLRFAYAKIKLSQYKMLKYSEQLPKEKMGTVLSVAEKYFNTINFANDFERKSLLDLYNASEQYDKALEFAKEFENKDDPFYLQNLCKMHRGKENFDEAIKCIDQALSSNVTEFHKAAFLHDKAEALHLKKDKSCIDILQAAIDKQNTDITKKSWSNKKINWRAEFNS